MNSIILEYLRIALSAQCVAGAIVVFFLVRFGSDIRALMLRIASIRFPGGTELSAQLNRTTEEAASPKTVPVIASGADPVLPEGISLTNEQERKVQDLIRTERQRAFLWEYRYLNYFLVSNTQRVLEWLAGLQDRTTIALYDSWWLPIVPSADERRAMISALEAHHLIQVQNEGLIDVTPKGREYLSWRRSLLGNPA